MTYMVTPYGSWLRRTEPGQLNARWSWRRAASVLGQDAQALRVIERRELQPGRPVPLVGPDQEVAGLQPLGAHAVLAVHLSERDRATDRVAVGGGADVADPV